MNDVGVMRVRRAQAEHRFTVISRSTVVRLLKLLYGSFDELLSVFFIVNMLTGKPIHPSRGETVS